MHCGLFASPAWRKRQPLGLCEKDLKLTLVLSGAVHRLVFWNALQILCTLPYPLSEIEDEPSCSL